MHESRGCVNGSRNISNIIWSSLDLLVVTMGFPSELCLYFWFHSSTTWILCPMKWVATIFLKTWEGSAKQLMNVLCVLNFNRNLLSIANISDCYLWVYFNKKESIIINMKNNVVAKGFQRNKIYELLAYTNQANACKSKLWHRIFSAIWLLRI